MIFFKWFESGFGLFLVDQVPCGILEWLNGLQVEKCIQWNSQPM